MPHRFLTLLTIGTIAIHTFWGCHLCRRCEVHATAGEVCCHSQNADADHGDHCHGDDAARELPGQERHRHLPCACDSRCKFVTLSRPVDVDFTFGIVQWLTNVDDDANVLPVCACSEERARTGTYRQPAGLRAQIQVWVL